jgi:hypothetical protein
MKLCGPDPVVPGSKSKTQKRSLHRVTDFVHCAGLQPNKTSKLSIAHMKIKTTLLSRFAYVRTAALAALAFAALASTPALADDNDNDRDDFKFDLVPSKGLPAAALNGTLKNAHGRVKIESGGPVEIMDVAVWGLPPIPTSTSS